MEQIINSSENKIVSDIRSLIEQSRLQVAAAVNTGMTLMYWHIGERINREVLGGERAAYGKQIVATISQRLTAEYGGSQFSVKNLNRMRLFAERFPDLSIWTPLVSKLSWSHFLQVIAIEDDLKRQFYLTMAADQRWSKTAISAWRSILRNCPTRSCWSKNFNKPSRLPRRRLCTREHLIPMIAN